MKTITKKTQKMRDLEAKHGIPVEEVLRQMYVDEDMKLIHMSKVLNASYMTVYSWLQAANIVHRKIHFKMDK